MSITFSVIDVNCQQADDSFFHPAVQLTAKSTSTFATVLGYSEFVASVPPKKYKTITFSGSSTRVAFTAEQTPRQCAGANYTYSGAGSIDIHGNQISNYSKNFFAQCSKAFWPLQPLQVNPNAIAAEHGVFPRFVGYCWPADPESCPTCDPNPGNWSFLGNKAVNEPAVDLGAFLLGSAPNVTSTSWSINETFTFLTSINQDVPYQGTPQGPTYPVVVGAATYNAQVVLTNPSPLTFPVVSINSGGVNYLAEYAVTTDTNNYSAVLSDEYTDAQALANAQVVTGTGTTAQNLPRTTGFTSVTTNVVYTLLASNLIVGRDYVVTVDLWEQPTNTHTPKTYNFTADQVTHTIIDAVPTPTAGHTITVKSPTVAFA